MIPITAIYKGQQLANTARTEARPDMQMPGYPCILRIGRIVAAESAGGGYQVDVVGDDGTKTGETLRDIHCIPAAVSTLSAGDLVWLVQQPGNRDCVILNASGGTSTSSIDNCGMVTE